MNRDAFDVVVIGGGPGGYATAFRAVDRGLKVAVVEGDLVGGTCLNRGCIPSKAALHVAEVLEQLGRGASIGLNVTGASVDGHGLDAFRTSVMDRMRSGLAGLLESRTTFFAGWGSVVSADDNGGVVRVALTDGTTTSIDARAIVLATGSVPRTIRGVPQDGRVVLTSDEAVRFTTPPPRAVIVGAGAIGMEFASMWRSMGSEVTVVEAAPRVLPLEDEDCSTAVRRAFRRRGIGVLVGATVESVQVADSQRATVTVSADGATSTLEAEVVLMAVGRRPRTDELGLEPFGIVDERGHLATNRHGRTAIASIWGVGDVQPTLALAHAAFAEGFVVADAIAGRSPEPVDFDQVPRVTYCHPEVASVGLTEARARQQFGDVHATTYSLKGNAKAVIEGVDGFAKVVCAGGADGPVLGVHIVGPRATDLIGEATLATSWGALPRELAAIVHAHPTLYEALGEAFLAAAGTPFHAH
ncbi:MAG: dihydrolipoyl dehydrogenase [Actinomycetota bacterium]|nr:dihydrolipoyl dehydrogenase [Actinomycetota bacterium]